MKNLRVTLRSQNDLTGCISFAEEDFDTEEEFFETVIQTLTDYKEMREKLNGEVAQGDSE